MNIGSCPTGSQRPYFFVSLVLVLVDKPLLPRIDFANSLVICLVNVHLMRAGFFYTQFCANVALDSTETRRNMVHCKCSSIFKGALNFLLEVQHVINSDWSPPDKFLSVSNNEMWNHSHFPLSADSEEVCVRPGVTDSRTGMLVTGQTLTPGIPAAFAASSSLLYNTFLA